MSRGREGVASNVGSDIPERLQGYLISVEELSVLLERTVTYLKRIFREAGIVSFGQNYRWTEVEAFWVFRGRAFQDGQKGIESKQVRYEKINRDFKKRQA